MSLSASETRRAPVGTLELAYETFGDPDAVPVLLIMGFATQMLAWPDEFCAQLAERGHHVVRFDNRDIGLSTHLAGARRPDLAAVMAGGTVSAPYGLSDMASDAAGLIAALGWESAHVVGASMGGMIAQLVAVEHPQVVRSLTSIMSTTDRRVGAPTEAATAILLRPAPRTREEAVERSVEGSRVIGSPGFDRDEESIRERTGIAWDRAHDPDGVLRQLVAILTAEDRAPRLRDLDVPAVVIHGADDPLVQPEGGRATAAAIPGAELRLIPGMGHDLPRGAWPQLLDGISAAIARGEASA